MSSDSQCEPPAKELGRFAHFGALSMPGLDEREGSGLIFPVEN
jgi:hypothetical protein